MAASAGGVTLANTTLTIQRTAAAVAGTEMLSSRRTGIVSTNAAVTAARRGATITNIIGGSGAIAARVHHARAIPPEAPNRMNAAVPATLLSRFHGSLGL